MYNEDTDLLFPPRVIYSLRELRGFEWDNLINNVINAESTDVKRLAFVLLMVKMGGCTSCHSDSYRAIRGCTHCSQQTIRRFRGSDQELIDLYNQALNEVEIYLSPLGDNYH
jgi:hypothetical protein